LPDVTAYHRPWGAENSGAGIARNACIRAAGVLMLVGVAAMLGACSKCDLPTPWEHGSLGGTPAACHAAPQPD
jgi:hypothetical protein